LTVRDFGSGLTAEETTRAFERFYRSDEGRSREGGGGAGIGLAVVKRIAESHGGKVEFLKVETGALVHLTLPISPAGMAAVITSQPKL
jgi:two-component system OmpR family sensor kinase